MKTWISTFFLVLLAFTVTSCLKTNDDKVTNYYDVLATVTSDNDYPTFLTDNGTTLTSTNKLTADTANIKIGNRLYVRYEFGDTIGHALKTYPIIVAKLWKVDIKNFVTLEKDSTDKYYNQALQGVYNIDIEGNYFNMIFNTFAKVGNSDAYELVRLKSVENTTPLDTVPTIYFELRHNVYTANYVYYNTRFASFKLNPLLTEFPLAKKFILSLKWLVYPDASKSSYIFTYVPATFNTYSFSSMKRNRISEKTLPFSGGSFSSGLK